MTETPSFEESLKQLKARIHEYRNAVLPVVGAGLSLPVPLVPRPQRLPLWRELLQDLIGKIDNATQRNELTEDLGKDKFLQVAQSVADILGDQEITAYVNRTFARPPMKRPPIYNLLASLPLEHFATTNYDPWLLQAVREAGRSEARQLTPFATAPLGDTSTTSIPFVFHLHGTADVPQHCVLTADSYDTLQANTPFTKVLQALANQRSLLFLGYSLTDPDLESMLARWQKLLEDPAPRHFLLTTDLRDSDRRRLLRHGVLPVEFAKNRDYGRLADVLRWLGDAPPRATRAAARQDPTRYLKELLAEVSKIQLRGLGSGRTGRSALQVDIERLYTQLRLHSAPMLATGDPAAAGRELPTLPTLLRACPRLLLEGQPGCGKTTFLRFVTAMLARDQLRLPCQADRTWRQQFLEAPAGDDVLDQIPVFVRASELVTLLDQGNGKPTAELLLDHLAARWRTDNCGVDREFFRGELAAGRAILFLDGLDEITDDRLRVRMESVFQDLCRWQCRIVVTSRPIATELLEQLGFARAVVAPFAVEAIEQFLELWVRALYDATPDAPLATQEAAYRDELRSAIVDEPRIRRLAQNPVMLTCLAVVHWNEGELPEGRSRVYRAVIRWLLAARSDLRKQHGFHDMFAELAFASLALAMMQTSSGKQAVIDEQSAAERIEPIVLRQFPQQQFPDLARKGARLEFARRWLRFEAIYSGILQELAGHQLRFWHLTFQEHLAATQLASLADDEEGDDCWWPIVKDRLEDAQWRETIEMFPCCLLDNGGNLRVDRLLARVQSLRGPGASLAVDARVAAITARLLEPLRVFGFKAQPELEAAHQAAMQRALAVFTLEGSKQVPWQTRVEIGEELGRGGDPRILPGLANFLPVPSVPGLLLGKYLVTVQEFLEFVEDEGYERRELWTDDGWRQRTDDGWSTPGDWDEQLRHPNRPVVSVSWYEAAAYCAWMDERYREQGHRCHLPTGPEWEATANSSRGDFPWGNPAPDPERANFGASNIDAPTPVGCYPTGAGPHGHLDLAGNVWEWSADVDKDGWPFLRGGGFGVSADNLRVGFRNRFLAVVRFHFFGFRVAVSPASTA